MEVRKLIVIGVTAGLLAAMTACGSGSGDSGVASSSKQITGAITAFGSVYVNGNKYNTDNATVYVEGNKASESDLRVGMMVTVKESSTGVAASIHFGDDVEGFVISNDILTDGTLDVMGQTVTVDSNTIFESHVLGVTTAAEINIGNIVEVSGSSSGLGNITATRLEVKAATLAEYLIDHPNGIEVKGIVTAHDEVSTFKIGEMVVDYSTADITDMPAGNWDGLYVEAKSMQDLNAGQLVASKVELENEGSKEHHGDDEDEIEVSGAVTEVTDSSVTVNGQTFLLDANTRYEHGTLADLIVGAMVEVEGHFNSNSDLVADKIEFKDHETENEIKGYVDSIVLTGPNEGTIVVEGQTIMVNHNTIMHDSSAQHNMSFNLSMLEVGDFVEVHYVVDNNATWTATKLERETAKMQM